MLWDLVALYPPTLVWMDALPVAVLFDGPVVDRQPQIQELLLSWQPPTETKETNTR